jgi:hypothetical protein
MISKNTKNYGAADDEFGGSFISEAEFNKRHKKALKDAEPSGIKRKKKKKPVKDKYRNFGI